MAMDRWSISRKIAPYCREDLVKDQYSQPHLFLPCSPHPRVVRELVAEVQVIEEQVQLGEDNPDMF